jgi:hypothetical protein
MTVDKSISKFAARRQMLKVYGLILKPGEHFSAASATKNFKAWFNSHKSLSEQCILALYVDEILTETEKRLKLVRTLLMEEGYAGNPQKNILRGE